MAVRTDDVSAKMIKNALEARFKPSKFITALAISYVSFERLLYINVEVPNGDDFILVEKHPLHEDNPKYLTEETLATITLLLG